MVRQVWGCDRAGVRLRLGRGGAATGKGGAVAGQVRGRCRVLLMHRAGATNIVLGS